MDSNLKMYNEKKILRTISALEKNNMNGYYIKNKDDLIKKIEELVSKDSVVACGGSMTLFETGIIDYLRSGRYTFLDRYKEGITQEEVVSIYNAAFTSDAYFVSTNAITEKGELYNVDGTGNRVAAMIYGPKKVIIICGVNKIVPSIEAAIERNERVSAPINAMRLNRKTPCKEVGYCMNCRSEERICNDYVVIRRQSNKDRIHVLFLNEELGY